MNSSGLQIELQRGGKQIAEGAFGCIFSPPLKCADKPDLPARISKRKLGKLTGYEDIKNEIAAAKYLKQFSAMQTAVQASKNTQDSLSQSMASWSASLKG